MNVVEKNSVINYLKKRNLTKQYLKTKQHIISDNFRAVDLKRDNLIQKIFGILELLKNIVL